MNQKTAVNGYIFIFLAGCLWGTQGIFVHAFEGVGIGPSGMSFLRYIGGTLTMLLLLLLIRGKGGFRISRTGLLLAMLTALSGHVLFTLCYTTAISMTGMSVAVVLLYLAPVFVLVMSRIFYKERVTGTKIIAVATDLLGCVLVVTGGHFGALSLPAAGVLAGIGAGFFYASMTVISKKAGEEADPLTLVFYTFVFSVIMLFFVTRGWETVPLMAEPKVFIYMILYGLVPTSGSYGFYLYGMSRGLETSRVPVVCSVETVVAALLGFALFQEAAGIWKLAGIGLVLLSIFIMNRPEKTASGEKDLLTK